ncbi:hypothetical protein SAMN05216299_10526 [Nitrosospira sp. Nsp14]|uniref:hypothetical protein n=1 Tax=Nitrosospira sp. Nsp14 TaxID=1855333 RepID=UPI0008E25B68|nr:hypothetical protein [Nitrosospira sp. Nsp14]SFH28187.1 hypothetical protein SAMN05216299_10526 [Nitrosospira sp. Nsp14]
MNEVSVFKNQELSLQLNEKTLADLILNFLGKKEKLNYREGLTFVLSHNDIEQFYYLLNKKIEKEQNIHIEHFLVTVSYHDNTEREISGIEALNKYLETRDVYPESVTLTWNIVVKYPNAETIENQVIELTFVTTAEKELGKKGDEVDTDGAVILSISHTNQAWGIEVLNLLKDKIRQVALLRPQRYLLARKIYSTFYRRERFSLFLTTMMMIGMTASMFFAEDKKSDQPSHYKFLEAVSQSGLSSEAAVAIIAVEKMRPEYLEATADKLIKHPDLKESLRTISQVKNTKDSLAKQVLWGFTALNACLFFFYPFYLKKVMAHFGERSHILLTKRAGSNRINELAGKSKGEFYSLTFIAFSLATGIVGNFIYQFLIRN